MQDDEQARTTVQIALLDLEYVIADLNACVNAIATPGQSRVKDALTQLEAAKRELMGAAYRSPKAGAASLH